MNNALLDINKAEIEARREFKRVYRHNCEMVIYMQIHFYDKLLHELYNTSMGCAEQLAREKKFKGHRVYLTVDQEHPDFKINLELKL